MIYTKSIYKDIINTTNASIDLKFGIVGIFLIIIHVKNRELDIIYYITPSIINVLIKKKQNFRAILGLSDKGSPKEIEDLLKE